MDTAIAALIIVTLILVGMLTLAHGHLSAQAEVLESGRAMEERIGQRSRTGLLVVGAKILTTGTVLEITVRNDGNAKLSDFGQWDVILQYDAASGRITGWYPYVRAVEPGHNQWTVMGIYLDAAQAIPEAHEPGILNPGEEMVLRVRVSPPALDGTTNLATIATPNGISASAILAK